MRKKKNFLIFEKKFFFFCEISNPCGANPCSLVEIHRHHPIESTVLVGIQWQPPFRGIFQNLYKEKEKLELLL